jgi:UDP-N-acetylglucosamine 4,6-dehydratase
MSNVLKLHSKSVPVPALFEGQSILITGGTGSFGKKCVETLLKEYKPARIIIYSRDEMKQHEMQAAGFNGGPLRYFIGDVRDKERLIRAMNKVDLVIHAAALKHVPSCEYNPMEAIMTNVVGTRNVIEAALDAKVAKVMALSTDKAVNPVNLYGATKLCAEKLLVQSNYYSGDGGTRFACVRYGNVVGSRGSVIPVFLNQRDAGEVTVTDPRMSRFWLTLDQGVKFVLDCISTMQGGEVFVPKIPSMNMMDLVEAMAPQCKVKYIGIRPGEKLHEALLGEDEARHTIELDHMYIIKPSHAWWDENKAVTGKAVNDGFSYASNTNEWWLSKDELQTVVESSFPGSVKVALES